MVLYVLLNYVTSIKANTCFECLNPFLQLRSFKEPACISHNHTVVSVEASIMAEFNSNEEATGGHEMWPVEEDELIIGHGGYISDDTDGARNTVTVYLPTGNGIVTRTFNEETLYTDDMFRSQDPDLCAPSPNDPQEDSSETPDIDVHASMELCSDEDDGPGPSNRMSDHPTPPELRSVSGATKKQFSTPARTTDSDSDYNSKYDHLTPCSTSDDEDENLPIRASDYPGVRPSRLSEYIKKLTPAEIKSQDFIYEDLPPTVSGVRKKQFSTSTPATTTDSDSDVDYSEFPLSSNTSRSYQSSNGINDFTCAFCKRRFCKEQSLKTHVYWHTTEPQEESQSETSEDVPILSSGAENDYELFHISDGNIVENGPLKQLNLRDFTSCLW